jgi:hypothetical protein
MLRLSGVQHLHKRWLVAGAPPGLPRSCERSALRPIRTNQGSLRPRETVVAKPPLLRRAAQMLSIKPTLLKGVEAPMRPSLGVFVSPEKQVASPHPWGPDSRSRHNSGRELYAVVVPEVIRIIRILVPSSACVSRLCTLAPNLCSPSATVEIAFAVDVGRIWVPPSLNAREESSHSWDCKRVA